ncbi:MAG: hypothetical protein JNJ94_16030 [Chlorobi bacterium]|nr:hypothetical protein [Chlorobiota bacterium]
MILGSLVVMMLLSSSSAQSQYRQWVDTTLPKVVKPYGVGASEFLLGSYKYFYTKDRPVTELWDYYNSIGISTVLLCASDHYRSQFDSFLLATNRPQNGRVIVADAWKVIQATSAREIEFYPFDSSQSRKWGYNECVALSYDDDVTQLNEEYDPMLREAIYDVSDAGTLALGDIAYNYQPYQFSSFRQVEAGSGWRTVHPDSVLNRYQLSLDTIGKTYYIALTGHLFEGGSASQNAQLFRIEVWHEVNKGEPYFPQGDSVMQTATDNLSSLYRTVYVLKQDLDRSSSSEPYNKYHTFSIPINLGGCSGCMSGPLQHSSAESRQFNLKVYYEGGEKVALRSVAIRDSIAEMMIGTGNESVQYRDLLLDSLTTLLRNTDGSLRSQIITVYGKDEPRYEYFAGARELNKMLRANFNVGGDSLSTETALAVPHHQDLGTSNTLWWETYVNEPFDKTLGWSGTNLAERFGVDLDSQPPALKEHNGGRFTIPEMFSLANILTTSYTTLQQKIESFNEMYNQMYWGRYTPYEPSF